ERRDESLPQDFQQRTTNKKRQHCEMEGVQSSQPQEKKPPHAKTLEQPLLVVCRDDKAAQDEKEIDEKPGVAQERHIVQMAVGVQMEQRHQACGDTAPAVEHHESSHIHRLPSRALGVVTTSVGTVSCCREEPGEFA